MAFPSDEIALLERVFLRIGSGETDKHLEDSVSRFLPPVLLKMASQNEVVRSKVAELCIHITKRLKSRPLVQVPIEDLLLQYNDPFIPMVVKNLSLVYIKMGYPRLPADKQVELIPSLIRAINGKPQEHIDCLIMLVVSALHHIQWPRDPVKCPPIITKDDKPKIFSEVLLDVLLMPNGWTSTSPIPPGLSSYAVKRITNNLDFEKKSIEQVKLSILKCISNVYKPDETLCHFVVSSADQWYSVSSTAENELKILLRSGIDWGNPAMLAPLFTLYLGSNTGDADKDRVPADLRLKLKILPHMAKATGKAVIWPICIKVIFDTLHGESMATGTVASKIVLLGLNYCSVVIDEVDIANLRTVSRILLDNGLQQLVPQLKGSPLQERVYVVIGKLVLRIPELVKNDLTLLSRLFTIISQEEDKQVQVVVKETLMNMVSVYSGSDLLLAFLATQTRSPSVFTRLVAIHYLSNIFPCDHNEARFWLLTTTGDSVADVSTQGLKALYGAGYRPGTKWKPVLSSSLKLPEFSKMVMTVADKCNEHKSNSSMRIVVNNKILPFNVTTYSHVIKYLRLCLVNSAGIDVTKDQDSNVVDNTVFIRKYLHKKEDYEKILDVYLDMSFELLHAQPDVAPLTCILEICGSLPDIYASKLVSKLDFIKGFLQSNSVEMRELSAMLYAVILAFGCEENVLSTELKLLKSSILAVSSKLKDIELLHGYALAIGYTVERSLASHRVRNDWPFLNDCISIAVLLLKHDHTTVKSAACKAVAEMGKHIKIPMDSAASGKILIDNEEPVGILDIINWLQAIIEKYDTSFQLVEEAYKAIGSFCLIQDFPLRQLVIDYIIKNIKQTKAVDIHICVSKILVDCVLGPLSPSSRDPWTVTLDEFQPPVGLDYSPNEILSNILQRLLDTVVPDTHPNSRQGVCMLLLSLLKHCGNLEIMKQRLFGIQSAFFDLLSEKNDIVQDAASKGLSLVYENGSEEMRSELIKTLVDQLSQGRRTVAKVSQDTQIFEEGELGKTPSGGSLTTYKELCSLASELNKPDLIYDFMHLANHNATWNSKLGAAFGFTKIAEAAGEQLAAHKAKIIPKLYRYQFDPTPKVQNSMTSIWHAMVPETHKTVDEYHREIFEDLISNLTSGLWRVRISCCLALSDFLTTSGKRVFEDCVDMIPNLWSQLLRVMDDIHEETRNAAKNTTRTLSKICIRCCEGEDKKSGEAMMKTILPVLLDNIGHQVRDVRSISIKTLSQLVKSAGPLLRPHLSTLVPTLLEATGELLDTLFTQHGNDPQLEGALDNFGSVVIKSHYSMDTITKCIHYIDGEILGQMLPRLVDLLKPSSGLAPRVSTANFLNLLNHHLSINEFQPHVGKLLTVLVTGLSDRNRNIRRTFATCIGQLVRVAKDSSIDKLVEKLKSVYLEKEDVNIRSAIGLAFHTMAQNHQEKTKTRAEAIVPLVFFAMHISSDNKIDGLKDSDIWEEVWHEVTSGGTEGTLLTHMDGVSEFLQLTLLSASWPVRAQAARAIKTVSEKVGASLEADKRDSLLDLLIDGLQGRVWDGKEHLLVAIATFCESTPSLKNSEKVITIVNTVLKECKKTNPSYRKFALTSIGDILEALDVDKFADVYALVEEILAKNYKADNPEDTDENEKRQQEMLSLRVAAFETLGKAWPTNETTQVLFREKVILQSVECLQNNTRSVQVSIMVSVIQYLEKLTLLSKESPNENELEELKNILSHVRKALEFSLSIPKHTRLRKEALNVFLLLVKKLQDNLYREQLHQLNTVFNEHFEELSRDNSPEIKTRVIDIKEFFKTLK